MLNKLLRVNKGRLFFIYFYDGMGGWIDKIKHEIMIDKDLEIMYSHQCCLITQQSKPKVQLS